MVRVKGPVRSAPVGEVRRTATGRRAPSAAGTGPAARFSADLAAHLMRQDMETLAPMGLDADPDPGPRRRASQRQVEAVYRGLLPILDPDLLAESLSREAGLQRALRAQASALRIGYALRYRELVAP